MNSAHQQQDAYGDQDHQDPREAAYLAALNLQQTLQKIVEYEPNTEFLDLQNQNIESIEHNLQPYISRLVKLKELNLEDNEIRSLPKNLAPIFPSLENLNLNGNNFDDDKFQSIVTSLSTLPRLTSLYINLHEEEQVDMVMRILDRLEFLNGLPVEREILEEEEEESEEIEDQE